MPTDLKISREIMSPHCSSRGGAAIDHIVIHYTTSRNIGGTINHFLSAASKVSAHYIVGQDGETVRMVPDTKAAWHAGNSAMNRRSIGIEHVAAAGDKITPAQEQASAELIRFLVGIYKIPTANIIPHVAVKSTSCPGDLFAAYGGKAGADKHVQGAALAKWLTTCVFAKPDPAPEAQEIETVSTFTPAPAPAQYPEAQPASSSLTIWGALTSLLSIAVPYAATKTGLPITTELVMGLAGVVMTIIGRAATSPLKMR